MSVYAENINGTVLGATDRKAPWLMMGTSVDVDENLTTAEMMKLAGVSDWNLRLVPSTFSGRTHLETFEVVRDNPVDGLPDVLGVVGSRYQIFQNEELFAFGDNLIHGGARWEVMAPIKHGTVVFGAMKLEGTMYLGGEDEIQRHLILHTSHNGSTNLTASIVAMRMRCSNALNVSMKGALRTFKIRHTQSMDGKVAEARRVLALSEVYFDKFSEEMHKLIDATVKESEVGEIFELAYPKPEKDVKGAMKRWEDKQTALWDIYNSDTLTGLRGTKYGVFNALEERLDWGRKSRTGNEENILAAASGFDPVLNKEKDRVLDLVRNF